nr:pol-like protein [Danio rerio]
MKRWSPVLVMRTSRHLYAVFCLWNLLCFWLFLAMGELNIASLNINGAREGKKRFYLFEMIKEKKIDVLFVQETHSDALNACDWAREYNGLPILSHLSSVSGGVAVLFSKNFIPCSYQVEEIINGRLLKIRAQFENSVFVFISVYVPTRAIERMCFLETLSNVLANCNTEDVLILGGDFNCTESSLDRNHVEPHMPSQRRLIQLIHFNDITDIWRNFNSYQRQYTWLHTYDNLLSLARLDRFYGYRHQLNLFKECVISPVGFSDHSLVKCSVTMGQFRPKSAYWHLNTNLLSDCTFQDIFKEFWSNFKSTKSTFCSIQQWWDFAKTQVKQLCQQYTINVTKDRKSTIEVLENEIKAMQEKADASGDLGFIRNFKEKKNSLNNLLDLTAQGALVRSRFQNIESMDAPSKFFFNLERKNGQKRCIYNLLSETGILLSESSEIRKRAVNFYQDLYKSEIISDESDTSDFFNNLPQVPQDFNVELKKAVTLEELQKALQSMECNKVPGIDGLPAEFYKTFWKEVGLDLLQVINESLAYGQLPLSCRRAVLTLLPKKGDLNDIKNWRPVSLLCTDYKLLSKVLANRLSDVLSHIIHPDQSYCVPGRRIFDNISFIRDILDIGKIFNLNFGLLSLDQEKAFDRVEHKYLWNTLTAFGFNNEFVSMLKALYNDVESVLKFNGNLCAPFKVFRGIRQGCALSGMLYTLAIEPLLIKIRAKLSGLSLPSCTNCFKVSAYADDIVVLINGQIDVTLLLELMNDFKKISATKINWSKSEALLVGNWHNAEPKLPEGLTWTKQGFKYLGVFLGDELIMQKNFEDIIEKVRGRLERWKFLLSKISYKGRVLIINNLIASALWHRLICVDPPSDLLIKLQSLLIDFFWDKMHWVQKAILYLPKEEGGHHLMHIQSRVAAFRIQFIQRLLTGPVDSSWKIAACAILRGFRNLGLEKSLFWTDPQKMDWSKLPIFYRNMFKVWSLFKVQRHGNASSLFWLLQEPLIFGSRMDLSNQGILPSVNEILLNAGVVTVGHLFKLAGPAFRNVEPVANRLGLRSKRIVAKLLEKWKSFFTPEEANMLENYADGLIIPNCNDPFPDLYLSTDFKECEGVFLQNNVLFLMGTNSEFGKNVYNSCVKLLNRKSLNDKVDTPWRSVLHLKENAKPEWRALYKPPLPKKVGDLQWRILHGAIAVNAFVSIINPGNSDECPFCSQRETLYHAFMLCNRLSSFFQVLSNLFVCFGETFSMETFICGYKYTRKRRFFCQLLNFLLGQAKMAIYDTRKIQIEQNSSGCLKTFFFNLVKSRILIDFQYYKTMGDLMCFEKIWCYKGVLCQICDENLEFMVH